MILEYANDITISQTRSIWPQNKHAGRICKRNPCRYGLRPGGVDFMSLFRAWWWPVEPEHLRFFYILRRCWGASEMWWTAFLYQDNFNLRRRWFDRNIQQRYTKINNSKIMKHISIQLTVNVKDMWRHRWTNQCEPWFRHHIERGPNRWGGDGRRSA